MEGTLIRPATQADLDALVGLELQFAEEIQGLTLHAEVVRKGIQTMLNQPELGEWIVIDMDKRVVGMVSHSSLWNAWRGSSILWADDLFLSFESPWCPARPARHQTGTRNACRGDSLPC